MMCFPNCVVRHGLRGGLRVSLPCLASMVAVVIVLVQYVFLQAMQYKLSCTASTSGLLIIDRQNYLILGVMELSQMPCWR